MCTQCVCNFLSLVSRESDVHASEDALIAFSQLCVCSFLALVADESGGWTMCFVFVFFICIFAISCSCGLVGGGLVGA